MSRGHGKLQRDLLDTLRVNDQPIETIVLAALVFECQPDAEGRVAVSAGHISSTQRALSRLAAQREVYRMREYISHYHNGLSRRREYWMDSRQAVPLLIDQIHSLNRLDDMFGGSRPGVRAQRAARLEKLSDHARELGLQL